MKRFLLLFTLAMGFAAHGQNSAITFDGTGDYVSIPHNAALNLSTFTLEAWVWVNNTTSSKTIIAKGDGNTLNTTNYIFNIGSTMNNSNPALMIGNVWYSANKSLVANTWNHCAVTVSGTYLQFYVNGAGAGSISISGTIYTSGTFSLRLGMQGDACQCNLMNGKLDDVRIWNIARSGTEIRENMFNRYLLGNTAGLVANYNFNEASGAALNQATNSTVSSGTLMDNVARVSSPIEQSANALKFDGVDDLIDMGNLNTGLGSATFSLEVWVKTNRNGLGILSCDNKNGTWENGEKILYINGGGRPAYSCLGNGTISSSTVVTDGNWHHIAFVWNDVSSVGKIYIDGVDRTQPSTFTKLYGDVGSYRIGVPNNFDVTNYYFGSLDEVRMWNRVRTATEIAAEMNSEISTTASGLRTYYRFNQGIAGGNNAGLVYVRDLSSGAVTPLSNFSLSGTASNYETQAVALVTLPVVWQSFTAQKQGLGVKLTWVTASEENTKDFGVQHSRDGRDWKDISIMAAAGSSRTSHSYTYTNAHVPTGGNYYRIRQRDLDGTERFSEIRKVNIPAANHLLILGNPLRDGKLKVRWSDIAAARAVIFDISGKKLSEQTLLTGETVIDLSQLPKGQYLLKVGDASFWVVR